jgi:hypothetical protein
VSFDIDVLLDFEPAGGRCVKCLALLPMIEPSAVTHECPVCGLTAMANPIGITNIANSTIQAVSPFTRFSDPFTGMAYGYGFTSTTNPAFLVPVVFNKDAMDHAKELARLGRLLRSTEGPPPLRVLVECMLLARAFVHFTTWGISQALLGVLAAVSEFVPVAGIASAVQGNTPIEIEKLCRDFPQLDIRVMPRRDGDADLIHTKLIVIDGLLALSGSPNLTTDAWRKAASNKERIDIVTNVRRVIEDNNRYFAQHWAELQTEFDPKAISWGVWNVYEPAAISDPDA